MTSELSRLMKLAQPKRLIKLANPPSLKGLMKLAGTTSKKAEKMSVQAIQDELNILLFDEKFQKDCDAKDRELLTIIISRAKAHHFDFLLGKTEWKVRGKWRRPEDDFDIEENVQLDVEFKDATDERIGKRVIDLLKAYNTKVVSEKLLYARTIPIEEGTL